MIPGIKINRTPQGKLDSIVIKPTPENEFIEDLIANIVYESRKDGETISHDELMVELRKMGKVK